MEGFNEMRYDTSEDYHGFSDLINEYTTFNCLLLCVISYTDVFGDLSSF
jgi:hypothetical protein